MEVQQPDDRPPWLYEFILYHSINERGDAIEQLHELRDKYSVQLKWNGRKTANKFARREAIYWLSLELPRQLAKCVWIALKMKFGGL